MNKKAIIAVIVLLLLGVGGFAFWKTQQDKVGGPTSGVSGFKSLKDLLSSGVAQKCTYSTTDEKGTSEGTTYVSGGKMRGDFTSVITGKTEKTHMITDGKTNYIWVDGEKTGLKTVVEPSSAPNPTDVPVTQTETANGGVDINKPADYKCSTWIADGSLFSPPADVKFTDFSEMFKPQWPP